MYMYKWSNFKDKYVVFRVFKIQTWDWEQVTPFRDSTIGVRKLYLYLLYRWLSARYLLTYYLEYCRHSLSYYLGNYTVFGLEKFMHLCPEKMCILTVTDSSRGLKSVCKFKICKNFANILHRGKIFFCAFCKIFSIFF